MAIYFSVIIYLEIILPFVSFLIILFYHKLNYWIPSQRAKHASVYLPGKQSWYDLRTGTAYKGGMTHKLRVSEDSIPAFQRAGTIISRKDRFRRSSTQMVNDPYTLVCIRCLYKLP